MAFERIDVVFADPSNAEARQLGAAALEQLGYAAESATWRNAYLLGALELRQGRPDTTARAPVSPDLVRAMSLDLFFDYLAVRLDGEKAEGQRFVLNWLFPDLGRRYVLTLQNCALTYLAGRRSDRSLAGDRCHQHEPDCLSEQRKRGDFHEEMPPVGPHIVAKSKMRRDSSAFTLATLGIFCH